MCKMIPDTETSDFEFLGQETKEGIQEWLEVNSDMFVLLDAIQDDLKTDTCTDNSSYDGNNNSNSSNDEGHDVAKPANVNQTEQKHAPTADGPPDDIRAFYGHPLTAATASANEADTHASAVALLHEYINLPALDRSGMKIGDKINSIYDIMRDDGSSVKVDTGSECDGDYLQLLQTTHASDVDKFFNQSGSEDAIITIAASASNCPVSIAEEVISEVCVETSNVSNERVEDARSFVVSTDPDSDEISNSIMTVQTLDRSRHDSLYKASKTPNTEKSGTQIGRRSREPREQMHVKPQELPKKLVKALAEKIMKRMNRKDHDSINTKSEIETAISNLPEQTSNVLKENLEVNYSGTPGCDLLKDFKSVDKTAANAVLDVSSSSLPVIQADTIDTSKVSLTPYSLSHEIQSHEISSKSPNCTTPSPMALLTKDAKCSPPVIQAPTAQNANTPIESAILNCQQTQFDCNKDKPLPAHHVSLKQMPYVRYNSVPGMDQASFNCTRANSVVQSFPGDQCPNPVYYFPDTNTVPMGMYNNQIRPCVNTDNDSILERYVQQQIPYSQEFQNLKGNLKESGSLKSPDSGIYEPCVSPRDVNPMQFKDSMDSTSYSDMLESESERQGGKLAKRRKSAPPMYVKQYWNPLDKLTKSCVSKLEKDPAGYKYFIDCPISTTQRIEEDRITYLNKGQFYGLTLEHDGIRNVKSQSVKSIIMVVFREDKHLDDERKAWEFWHSRQHSYKQRVIDIDTKNSINVSPSSTEEIAYNAVAVKWNVKDSPIKVNIAVHCLSTDFSNQKGVKGLPLHIQIDTYENSTKSSLPISRGYCQIKVFCDKGAERKIRDEERRKQCRVSKAESQPATKALRKRHEDVYHEALDRSEFYPMADLQSKPILFTPSFESDDSSRPSPLTVCVDEDGSSSITSSGDHNDSLEDGCYPVKRPRTEPYIPCQPFSNILLYVRESHEVVFTAIMLRSPTLHGLLQAVEEKYNVPVSKIKNSYKRSKKGILVRMDDNIIRHYSHESTFIIELKKEDNGYELLLTEIDPCGPRTDICDKIPFQT